MTDNTPTITRNDDGTLTINWPDPDRLPRTVEASLAVLIDLVEAHNALVAERDEARADAAQGWLWAERLAGVTITYPDPEYPPKAALAGYDAAKRTR